MSDTCACPNCNYGACPICGDPAEGHDYELCEIDYVREQTELLRVSGYYGDRI